MRKWSVAWVLTVVALCAGCGAPPLDFEAAVSPENLVHRRIERCSEWRDARRVDAGAGRAITLGPLPDRAIVRLGVLEGEAHGGRATIRVYAGQRMAARLRTGRAERWADYRIPLEGHLPGAICTLVFDSPQPVWIGPCEVIDAAAKPPPNVLIYLIDTLRRDHLHCYGYDRRTSPHLDALAQEGVLFTNLMPQSSWTKPSVASLFTSTYPNVHGAQDRPDVMREGLPDMAAAFARHGYETHGFITNPNILPLWGFGDGFFRYVDVESSDRVNADDAKVVDKAVAALDAAAGRPWFFYVHTMGPHEPYDPPGGSPFMAPSYEEHGIFRERRKEIDLYDGEIRYSDEQFGRFVAALKAHNLYENTLIVVLSDHGEEFWEHGGESHGKTLYEEVLAVPLIIKLPGGAHAGTRREALVELLDIGPTLLDLLGLPREERFQGRSIRDIIETGADPRRTGYASLVNLAYSIRAARRGPMKYIRDLAGGWERWYDLESDPGERHPHKSPPPNGESLRTHTARVAMRGGAGLHLLMTCGDEARTVEGFLRGPALGDFELQYYDWKGEAWREGDALHFRLLTQHPTDRARERDFWHTELAEQDHARLRIDAPADARIEAHVLVDGAPISPEWLHLGADRDDIDLAMPLQALDLVADSDSHDPAGLPRRFAVYLWYVADPDAIAPEELDPKMRDALEALGYL